MLLGLKQRLIGVVDIVIIVEINHPTFYKIPLTKSLVGSNEKSKIKN